MGPVWGGYREAQPCWRKSITGVGLEGLKPHPTSSLLLALCWKLDMWSLGFLFLPRCLPIAAMFSHHDGLSPLELWTQPHSSFLKTLFSLWHFYHSNREVTNTPLLLLTLEEARNFHSCHKERSRGWDEVFSQWWAQSQVLSKIVSVNLGTDLTQQSLSLLFI